MEANDNPRPKISLRMMFAVVAVFACLFALIGHHIRAEAHREALLKEVFENGGSASNYFDMLSLPINGQTINTIALVGPKMRAKYREIQDAFPDAKIVIEADASQYIDREGI